MSDFTCQDVMALNSLLNPVIYSIKLILKYFINLFSIFI